MTMSSILELLPNDFAPSVEEAGDVARARVLVTAADGKLLDAELAAFSAIAARMRGQKELAAADLDAVVDQFAHYVETNEIETRVRVLAPTLPEHLHELVDLASVIPPLGPSFGAGATTCSERRGVPHVEFPSHGRTRRRCG